MKTGMRHQGRGEPDSVKGIPSNAIGGNADMVSPVSEVDSRIYETLQHLIALIVSDTWTRTRILTHSHRSQTIRREVPQ